jgi:type IV pilus assembly protein PilZ
MRLPRMCGTRYDRRVWTKGWGFVMATKKERRDSQPPLDEIDKIDEEERRLGRDRRQWERVLVDLEVDYRSDDTFLFAYITDISAMGIFVRTVTPEPPGTRLNLRFCAPGAGVLEVEGVVIWINPYRPGDRENLNPGMGVQFVDLDRAQRERLKKLVRTFAYLSDPSEDELPLSSDEAARSSTDN